MALRQLMSRVIAPRSNVGPMVLARRNFSSGPGVNNSTRGFATALTSNSRTDAAKKNATVSIPADEAAFVQGKGNGLYRTSSAGKMFGSRTMVTIAEDIEMEAPKSHNRGVNVENKLNSMNKNAKGEGEYGPIEYPKDYFKNVKMMSATENYGSHFMKMQIHNMLGLMAGGAVIGSLITIYYSLAWMISTFDSMIRPADHSEARRTPRTLKSRKYKGLADDQGAPQGLSIHDRGSGWAGGHADGKVNSWANGAAPVIQQ